MPELLPLPPDHAYTEAEVVALLRERIADLLASDRDWLLGKMYRLDVRERDLLAALAAPAVDVPGALAALVVARQRERAAARERYRARDDGEIEEGLRW